MELFLNKNDLLDLDKNITGAKIVCGEGLCWITQSGDSRDYFVRTGQSFTAESGRQLIVVAMQPSRLMLTHAKHGKRHVLYKLIHDLTSGSLFANT